MVRDFRISDLGTNRPGEVTKVYFIECAGRMWDRLTGHTCGVWDMYVDDHEVPAEELTGS
jgi:hypothetical protein|tara:strand:- start:2289 stop:2468 length:180 start_codon:yes stop_codon:yes gene_type:complete